MAKFKAALDNKTHEARVKADMDAVTKAGARIGTPSFFINGKLLQGAQPCRALQGSDRRGSQGQVISWWSAARCASL